MTDFERQVLEKLEALETALNTLRSEFSISQVTYFENLSPFSIVGPDYVSFRFNCSQDAVIRGRFETDKIPRLRQRPLAWRKSDVDSVWQNLNRPISEVAAEIRHKTKNKIIRRKK